MSIKKSLLALVVLALAMTGLASSAMAATDGVLRDVTTNAIVPNGHETAFKGWAKFSSSIGGTMCHSRSVAKATNEAGTEGTASFEVPNVANCTNEGGLAGCTLTSVEVKNSPYKLTVTPTDFDVTGNIVLHNHYTGFLCPSEVTVEFSAVTLKPLGTTSKHAATNTAGNLGTTAAAGEGIAGVELEGTGTSPQAGNITAAGELEIESATDRSTWKIASS